MRNTAGLRHRAVIALLMAAVVVGFAATALAIDPVAVSVAVTGTPTPGATVTAKATVTINNGSTLQSITWTQVSGPTATLSNTTTDTITAVLPGRQVFKEHLIEILEEPPITAAQLPPNVPPPPAEFPGGLQNRFGVVGINPFALEEAGAIGLKIVVVTTSGTYDFSSAIHATLPWPTATGIRVVPVGLPVLLHGKTQDTYNWAMTAPTGSTATLTDAAGQSPEFTPDVTGTYALTVTNLADNSTVSFNVIAGTWHGVITGQTAEGRPVADVTCRQCHAAGTPLDQFTPWMASGHAEIFTQNVNTPNGHYSESCVSCHSVGYNKSAANGGFDDAPDFGAMMASGLVTHGDPSNWTNILAQFPASARLANIQCESCHGPQDGGGHPSLDGARATLSSDLCGTCHGEPLRHSRFQQWQLSGHANYELAGEEGTNASCAKCHSGQGFLAWEKVGFSATAPITVDWTVDEVHPQTCATCHDPHAVGTTSGGPTTNATVRIDGDTPALMSGYAATDVGRGAICMTCHNGRRGLRNDSNFNRADASRAPHVGPQADILMGQNLYFVETGKRSYHSMIEDSCVTCHMEATPPPPDLSYNLGGTNHTFYASPTICSKCHSNITTEDVQHVVETKMATLQSEIEKALKGAMQAQIRAGNAIDLTGGVVVRAASDIASVAFGEASGRQAVTVTLANGPTVGPVSLNSVKVVPPAGSSKELYAVADPNIGKAGWNLLSLHSDASKGVHNPGFVNSALDVTIFALKAVNAAAGNPAAGGGPGSGAGAVACTTPFVYWAEIAAHLPGVPPTQWRTDMVARNLGTQQAAVRFVLHQAGGNLEGTASIAGGAQSAFEDIVATLGGTNNKGSLEVCSDQPLLVLGRIFNQTASGTYGQFLDGHVADLGLAAGETASLIGLRQEVDKFRTNISVTNGGTTDAQVAISLFDAAGNSLTNFNLTVPAGQVTQDVEPFSARAHTPNLGWGFATVTVVSGKNVRTSASVIDVKTGDPTTIPGKQ